MVDGGEITDGLVDWKDSDKFILPTIGFISKVLSRQSKLSKMLGNRTQTSF